MAYRDISVWLEDILIALERIKQHTHNINSYSEYVEINL